MILEFKVCQLKKKSKQYKNLIEDMNNSNEFIIVGEELLGDLDCFKVLQNSEKGICLLGGLKIDEAALLITKDEIELKGDGIGCELLEMDIPKEYLTLEIIENIQRLNA